jgi:hypothetical protein
MTTMVTKLKATDMGEPVGGKDTPLLRHTYEGWLAIEE